MVLSLEMLLAVIIYMDPIHFMNTNNPMEYIPIAIDTIGSNTIGNLFGL